MLQIYHCVQLNALFCCLRNVEASCHKYFVVLSHNQHLRDFCLPHLHSKPGGGGFPWEYCYAVRTEKLEWCGYQMVKKF